MSGRLQISVLSGCLSMPDATSLPPEPSPILYYVELNSGIYLLFSFTGKWFLCYYFPYFLKLTVMKY